MSCYVTFNILAHAGFRQGGGQAIANLDEGQELTNSFSWRKQYDVEQVSLNAQGELHRFDQLERFGFDHTVSGEYQP